VATKPIVKGSTVKYKDGYYTVSALNRMTANLKGIFHRERVLHAKVPLTELTEAHEEWYAKWQESDTYKCM
jgi:hypothetical protein